MADWARRYTWELLLSVILLGTIVFNISESSGYLGVDNFVNLFQLHIEKAIVVVTMTFVIISGEIDLSVASVMAWSASVLAALHEHDVPLALAVAGRAGVRPPSPVSSTGWCVARLGSAIARRHAGRPHRLARRGACPRRGPLHRRLPRMVRSHRPGQPPRTPARSRC